MEDEKELKDIVIINHDHCYDGLASAWVAWKRFGNTASYISQKYSDDNKNIVAQLVGKEVYILDFSFPKNEMLEIESKAKKLVVIDHHQSAEETIKSMKEHVFSLDNSTAYLSWQYFFSDEKIPVVIEYISDSDTWSHKMPNWQEIESFIYDDEIEDITFDSFSKIVETLETKDGFKEALEIGAALRKIILDKVNYYISNARLVNFEGYEVYAIKNSSGDIRAELGHILAEETNSFALVFYYEQGLWKCSLRSVRGFDVSKIAVKYGGGGHKTHAAFVVPDGFPVPFMELKEGK